MSPFFRKVQQELVYQGFFNLRIDHFLGKDRSIHEYMCLESLAEGVIILGESALDQYVIVQEYRYPVEKHVFSLPGGRINKGETPLQGAQREFLEETGYEAASWSLLGEFYPFPSASDQKIWVFWAKDLKKTQAPQTDPLEDLSCCCLDLKQLFALSPEKAKLDSTIPMALFLKTQLIYKN
jgi:ADP-ribose pyrophosphatase